MPHKRNGIYRGKPKLDLHGLYSENGQCFGLVGGSGEASAQHHQDKEDVTFLVEVFPNVDVDVIQDVLQEYKGNLEECTQKLQEISGESSSRKMDEKTKTDLALIACSLLANESQPVGASTLEIYDSCDNFSNDLGCGAFSDDILHDHENLGINNWDFSLTSDVHESSSGCSNTCLSSSISSGYDSGKSSKVNIIESMNSDKEWSEQDVIPELNNDELYDFLNTSNKMLKHKPYTLNSLRDSSDLFNGKDNNELESSFLNYSNQFNHLAISANNIGLSPANLNFGDLKTNVDHNEKYFTYNNQINEKCNSTISDKKVNRNSELCITNENVKPEVPSDLLATYLNQLHGSCINSLSKTSHEWDTFYSSLESDGFHYNTHCESIRHDGEGEQCTAETSPTAMKDGYHPDSSIMSLEQKVSNGIVENMSLFGTHFSHKNDSIKAYSHVDNNCVFQSSESASSLTAANTSTCRLQTSTLSTGQNSSINYSSPRKGECEDNKKNNTSTVKLSSAALEFIPRPLAKIHSKPLAQKTAQVTTASINQNTGLVELLKPDISPARKKKDKAKKLNDSTKAESISPTPDSDFVKVTQPFKSGSLASSFKDTMLSMISTNAEAQNVKDPTDPLGWNNIFSANTSSQVDPKSRRSKGARKTSNAKSSQHVAPSPALSPWQNFNISGGSTLNASPKMKAQAFSVLRSKTSINPGASTFPSLHEITEHEFKVSDSDSSNTSEHISGTLKLSDSPVATRLPPSLISKAVPTTVATKINSLPKNVDLAPETRLQNPPSVSAQPQLIKNKLRPQGIETPVGLIRTYILEKQPVLVVLRGLPGSGKSYLAKQLIAESQQMGVQGVILSTDDYFRLTGQYCFNPNYLPEAHDWNKTRALQSMKESRSPIIIDNTNTTLWELLPYAVLALEHSYDVQIFEPDTSWRMKVVELARKNSHGVRKEHIKRMKDRWESFSLDDVLKQASHRIAASKTNAVLPGSGSTVPASPTKQQNLPVYKLMINPEQVQVTEVTHLKSSSGNTTPSFKDLGSSDRFGAQTQVIHTKMPSDKSLKVVITQNFLNQSLKKAIVNILKMPPPQVVDSLTNSEFSETVSWSETKLSNDLVRKEIIIKERHLSDESWNSESETPTADKDLQITNKLTEQFSIDDVRHKVQNEEVTAVTSDDSSDLLLELIQSEILDECSVFSNSCSTSCSYHTVASNSDISSYYTVDDDAECGEELSTDMPAVDDIEDIQLSKQHTHLLLQELQSHDGGFNDFNPEVMGADLLPVYFEQMTLCTDGDQLVVQQDSVKSNTYGENQGVKYESTVVGTIENNCRDPSKRAGAKQTLSFSNEPSSTMGSLYIPTVATSLGDLDSKNNSTGGSFTQQISGYVLPKTLCPSSLVVYSDSDESDKELPSPQKGQQVALEEQSELQYNELFAHKENVLDNLDDIDDHMFCVASGNESISGQMNAADCIWNVQNAARPYVRETSIDRSTQSSEDSMMSSRERSPQIDNQVIIPGLQHKKKKKRVRKGRNPGPFIEDSLKAKSRTQNWSSFVVPSSGSSNSSGDIVVLENPKIDTSASTTQTDPYNFSIVHKLNSPSFNNLQPVEWTLSGVEIITSSSQSTLNKRWTSTSNDNDTVSFRKIGSTVDQSTITDETLEKEEVDLETLQSCFPEYSRKQLETTMAICHNDLEWVTCHLLDSPTLYDMEDDEEEGRANFLEKDSVPHGSSGSAVKSLADMCTVLVRNTNKVDADDLEMQVIQVGEDRLQKIEMFGRSRLHSLSEEDLGNQDYWPDDFVLDDFPLPWAMPDLKIRQPNLIQSKPTIFKSSHFDRESSSQSNHLLSTLMKEKQFSSVPPAKEKVMKCYSSMPKYNSSLSSSSIEYHEATTVTDGTGEVSHPAIVQSQLVMPLDFVKQLESLYGSLHMQVEDGGLVLDDVTARKIYNCLKLKATKTVIKNSSEQQLKNDEALARILQDEENLRTSSNANHLTASAGKGLGAEKQSTVPGWTNQRPSWMTQGEDKVNSLNDSVNISEASTTIRPLSVADTLHQLRGTQSSRVRAHKFQKKMPGAVKSAWYKTRWRGQADSLVSIMEEEMAREEQQREQLRIIESTGDMEALATRIKRIELSNLFPSMGPDVLEDIFRSTGFSKEETIRVLQESYNIPPAPMSKDKEDILNQLRKSHPDFHNVGDFYEDDIPNEDSGMTYDTLRNEAVFCRQLATDCQQQALRYQSSGMQGAALFYRQRAKKYKENERTANFTAAQVLFEKGSERLQVENTLDLHFYRLDEAINAVNVAIEMKEDEYRKKPDKKNSYLDIVTGWGRNSKNGKPKLKPAIINHLWARCFQYEERSPGLLRVYIGKKLVA